MSQNELSVDFYKELSAALGQLLKPEGFKRQRLLWNKSESGRVAVIQVQKTRWFTPGEAYFTLNLGVCFEEVETICWGERLPKFITEVRCFPRFRIGELAAPFPSPATGIWWKVKSDDDLQRVIEDVVAKVSGFGLPFFKRIIDYGSAIQMVNQGRPLLILERIYLAIMFDLCGDHREAERILTEIAQSSDHWRPTVQSVLARLTEQRSNE